MPGGLDVSSKSTGPPDEAEYWIAVLMSPELLTRLRRAIEGAGDWYAIERAFTATVADDEVDDARPAAFAFGYMLVSRSNQAGRQEKGVFAPRIEWHDGGAFPPPLSSLEPVIHDSWSALFGDLDMPSAKSRLGDLLWVVRHGERPDIAARAAVAGYLTLAEDPNWSGMDRVACVSRALELATELNDSELRQATIDACLRFVSAELADEAVHRPGVPLRLLEQLVELPKPLHPVELLQLVERAAQRYGSDPFLAESLTELRLQLVDPDEHAVLRINQIERWRDAAQQAEGIVRLAHLQHALELARATGQRRLAEKIAVDIQQLSPEDLDLKQHSVSIEMPSGEIAALVASFAKHANPLEALARFGIEGPPTGNADEVDRTIADLAQRFPIQRLVTRQVLGDHNALIFEAQTTEQHDRMDRAQHHSVGIRLFAPIAATILDQIRDAYQRPDEAELTHFFATDLIDPAIAERLGEAVARYWNGDHDAAAHILVAQIEAAIRGIAVSLGLPVTKPPAGGAPGGVTSLGPLLNKLEGTIDESWRRYLINLLVEPLGVNLRNRLSHGLMARASAQDVAVLVHAACFLGSLSISRAGEPPPEA